MIRVLLVEDNKSLGQTLKERLQKEGYEVTWVETLQAASDVLERVNQELVLLDVGLPDGSGFDFAKQVRAISEVPFIFITAQTSAEDRLRGYELGAAEYIPKPFHLKELLMRVAHVIENHRVPLQARYGDVVIDFDSMAIIHDNHRRERLAVKDFKILSLLLEQSPRVVSRDEILNRVWGEEKFPTNRTVDNIIVRLRSALGDKTGRCIVSVRGVGYQWLYENEGKES